MKPHITWIVYADKSLSIEMGKYSCKGKDAVFFIKIFENLFNRRPQIGDVCAGCKITDLSQ